MTGAHITEHLDKTGAEAKAVVEQGDNIRLATRNLTLKALGQGQLDTEGMKKVVRSVTQGASLGIREAVDSSRVALNDALAGIDDALASSAEASKLAIEEAAGRLQDYGRQDLERAFDNLRVLEEMFLETIQDVAEHSANTSKDILRGLLQHARDSGTHAGKTANEAISTLEKKLGRTLHEVAASGKDATLTGASALAEIASGLLAGIAETLHSKASDIRNAKK